MLLFTPGPTPVPEFVRVAMAGETIHHRTPEFKEIFIQSRELLLKLFGMDEAIFLSSSGTGAMEASVINLCHKKALVVNAGKFGERFGKIARAFNLEVVELKYEWNTPATLEDIEQALNEHSDIDALFMQVSESAGGLRHPVEMIAKAVKAFNSDICVVADGITAVGVEPIDTTHIDCLISGSQKALMLPPGLAYMGLSKHAVSKIGAGKGYYLNIASELKNQKEGTTAYTAATTLIIGFKAMVEKVYTDGIEKLYATTATRAKAVEKAMRALGLEIYPKTPAKSMTTIIDADAEKIRGLLKTKYGVNVAGGQDHLKGKIFRINNMGLIENYEISWVVNAIELALSDLGRCSYMGIASKVYNETFFKE